MDTFQIVRNAEGKFDIFRGTEKVAGDLTHIEANRRVIAIQNKQIVEDTLRLAVRMEFLRATEDNLMEPARALAVMLEEVQSLQGGRPKFIPTVHSFAMNE